MSIVVDPWYDRIARIPGHHGLEERAKAVIKARYYATCEIDGGLSATTGVHLEARAFRETAAGLDVVVKSFLRRGGYSEGADEFIVSFPPDREEATIHRHHPVHQAVRDGDLFKIHRLHRKGIVLHEQDHTGVTPLELARQLEYQKIVEFLERN